MPAVDLDAAETLQTGNDPTRSQTPDSDILVDGAGRPLPPGAYFNKLGLAIGHDNRPLKGYKARKDLRTVARPGPWKNVLKKQQVTADAPAPNGDAPAAEEKVPSMTRARAEKKLAMRWGQLWDLCAEGWDDDALRVTADEEKEWAEPVAYVLEQMGWLHHTDKLDWVGAVAVTGAQAGPRVSRMIRQHPRGIRPHPDGEQAPPAFRRPAGMGSRSGVPVGEPVARETVQVGPVPAPVENPFPSAEGAGNPLPLDPRFMPREGEL